jgi:hypothetical protein
VGVGAPRACTRDVTPEQRFSGLRNRFSEQMACVDIAGS